MCIRDRSNLADTKFGKDEALKKDIQDLFSQNNEAISAQRADYETKLKELHKTDKNARLDFNLDLNQIKFPSEVQLAKIQNDKVIKAEYKSFVGFEIKNLFEFFMVFVILCGIAGAILALISPILKKMMHGVN